MAFSKSQSNIGPGQPDSSAQVPAVVGQQFSIGPVTFAMVLIFNSAIAALLTAALTFGVIQGSVPVRGGNVDGSSPAESFQFRRAPPTPGPMAGREYALADRKAPVDPTPERTAHAEVRTAFHEWLDAYQEAPARNDEAAVSGFTMPDAVEVTIGRPVRVALQLKPEQARGEPLLVFLDGLPPEVGIYGLPRLGSNGWRLRPGKSHEMQILAFQGAPAAFAMNMRLHRDDGNLIEQRAIQVVVKR